MDFQYDGATADGASPSTRWASQAAAGCRTADVDQDALPTLVLPVDKKVTIDLQSRDVMHSFWIIDFLYKKDMYIGHDNSWSFIPTREGDYDGQCAELCGEYHSMMLFNVKVVEQDPSTSNYLADRCASRATPVTSTTHMTVSSNLTGH